MSDLKLGTIIEGEQERDAIHIAVAPVVAGATLTPGKHVAIDSDGRAYPRANKTHTTVGIVDPFLPAMVFPGETFWLFLYPGSITSLRHDWTHPAFASEARPAQVEDNNRDLSRIWLANYASKLGVTVEDVIDGTKYGHGCIGTDIEYPSDVPDEFWQHFKIYTGIDIPMNQRFDFFRCAC